MNKTIILLSLSLLIIGCQNSPSEKSMPTTSDRTSSILLILQDIQSKMTFDDIDKIGKEYQKFDAKFTELIDEDRIEYTHNTLIPTRYIEYNKKISKLDEVKGRSFGNIYVNAYHPKLNILDINKDGLLDLIISAYETGRYMSPYYFLVYINDGKKLEIFLRYNTLIENGLEIPKQGYSLEWNDTKQVMIFKTYKSELKEMVSRRVFTIPVEFHLKDNIKKRNL